MKGNKVGFDAQIFKKAVKLAAGIDDFIQVQIFDAIVQEGSQDEDTMTCVVDSVDSTLNNLEVRYHICVSDGEVCVPKDGSVVTVAKTSFTDPYIVQFTELKFHQLNVEDAVITLIDGNVEIKQGDITVTLSRNKINIKNGEQDFKTLMDSFFDHISAMTFTNGAGTTGVPNNLTDFNNDKTNFGDLFN